MYCRRTEARSRGVGGRELDINEYNHKHLTSRSLSGLSATSNVVSCATFVAPILPPSTAAPTQLPTPSTRETSNTFGSLLPAVKEPSSTAVSLVTKNRGVCAPFEQRAMDTAIHAVDGKTKTCGEVRLVPEKSETVLRLRTVRDACAKQSEVWRRRRTPWGNSSNVERGAREVMDVVDVTGLSQYSIVNAVNDHAW